MTERLKGHVHYFEGDLVSGVEVVRTSYDEDTAYYVGGYIQLELINQGWERTRVRNTHYGRGYTMYFSKEGQRKVIAVYRCSGPNCSASKNETMSELFNQELSEKH